MRKDFKLIYKIIWIARAFWLVYNCFHSVLKHENDVSNMAGYLQVVRIYSFMKEIKVYIRASYIFFLFVKTESIIFIKEIKCSPYLHNLVKTLAKFVIRWKPSTASW